MTGPDTSPDAAALSAARNAALAEVDRAQRRVRHAIVAAALVEATLLAVFLALMDFGDRLHWLVLVAALLVYGSLAMGLVTLAAWVDASTRRVLTALALREPPGNEPRG